MREEIIPQVRNSIEQFLYEEEGKITRNKVLTVGSMMLIMGLLFATDVFAEHSSHRSHSSHKSHSSHSSGSSGSGHSSHESHVSHSSHSSHSSGDGHSSHSSGGSVTSGGLPTSGGATYNPEPEVVTPDVSFTASAPASDAMSGGETPSLDFSLPDTPKTVVDTGM